MTPHQVNADAWRVWSLRFKERGCCSEMLRHRSMVKLDALCSGVNPCMTMHGCTVDLSTWTR